MDDKEYVYASEETALVKNVFCISGIPFLF
jgi:hypothetical protein